MAAILRRASKYKRIIPVLPEGEAHLRDLYTPPPVILKVTKISRFKQTSSNPNTTK
jgi:hypothetical protein